MLIRLLWILPAIALITLVAIPSNADCQPGHGQQPYNDLIAPVLIDPEPIHAVERPAVIVQPVLTPAFSFQFLGSYNSAAPAVSPTGALPAGGSTVPTSPSSPLNPPPSTLHPPPSSPATPPPGRTLSDADIAALARALGRHPAAEVVEDDGPPVDRSASPSTAPSTLHPPPSTTMDPILLAAFRQSCTECHAAAVHRGGVTLFDSSGSFAPSRHGQPLSRETIRQAITSGTMPPDGRSFDPQALARLGSWTSQP